MIAGVVGGIVVGALPGMTSSMGIILLLPITYTLDPKVALVMLAGMYCGSMYGGSISAILLRTPGTPSASATLLDGYPLTQQGKAGKAISMATIGSLMLTFIDITGTYIITCIGLFLVGLGIGMFTPPNNSSIMGNVPKNVLGIAGGFLNMSRTLGMGLGVTFGGLIYQLFLKIYDPSNPSHLLFTFRSSYFVIAVCSFLTLLFTFKNYKNVLRHNDRYQSKEIGG